MRLLDRATRCNGGGRIRKHVTEYSEAHESSINQEELFKGRTGKQKAGLLHKAFMSSEIHPSGPNMNVVAETTRRIQQNAAANVLLARTDRNLINPHSRTDSLFRKRNLQCTCYSNPICSSFLHCSAATLSPQRNSISSSSLNKPPETRNRRDQHNHRDQAIT